VRPWKQVVNAVAIITTAAFLWAPTVLSAPAMAATAAGAAGPASILYVNGAAPNCSDTGSGTQAVPFCSIQAAANVVVAGQTVQVQAEPGLIYGAVTITHSGTSTAPITFTGAASNGSIALIQPTASVPSVTISGATDVTLSSFDIQHAGSEDGVDVTNSQIVTLNGLFINEDGTTTVAPNGVAINGTSSFVTVSRSQIFGSHGDGIAVQPGATHVTISTNYVGSSSPLAGISVDGAAADVTSNSVFSTCGDALSVTGSGTVVTAENNFLGVAPVTACSATVGALDVSSTAAAGTNADYNALYAKAPSPGIEYLWNGNAYGNQQTFHAATGQGTHDQDSTVAPTRFPPAAGSPLIDSADCGAPGEFSSDLRNLPHVDDPLVTDTGTGTCHADRGAFELQDPIVLTFGDGGTNQGIVPFTLTITITSGATSPLWNEPVSYSVNFGDGSTPQSVAAGGSVSHTYTVPGPYRLAVTAADTGGSSLTRSLPIVAGTTTPPTDGLTTGPDIFTAPNSSGISGDVGKFTITPGPDSWEVASTTLDFGDGSSTSLGSLLSWTHLYPHPGTYTATLTVMDLFGRVTTTKATITVGDEFIPIGPYVDRSNTASGAFTIGPFKAIAVTMARLNAASSTTGAAQLVVSVTGPGSAGSLIIYPDGTVRPAAADLAFAPGERASSAVLAVPGPDGKTAFFNNSPTAVTVGIRTTGIELTSNGTSGQDGDTYVPVGPVRVLDTRKPVHHPVKPGQKITFSVGSAGVPASADQVLLEVTATNTGAQGSATVAGVNRSLQGPPSPGPYWAKGQTATSLLVVPVAGTSLSLLNSSKANTDFMVDVVGYYNFFGSGAVYLPSRKLLTAGPGTQTVTIGGGHTAKVAVSGCLSAQLSNITAITASIEVTGAKASGFVTAFRAGTTQPGTRTLTYAAGKPSAGWAVVPVAGGAIELYNGGTRSVAVGARMVGCYYHYP
jgi:PKD domain/Right handed beta helix region